MTQYQVKTLAPGVALPDGGVYPAANTLVILSESEYHRITQSAFDNGLVVLMQTIEPNSGGGGVPYPATAAGFKLWTVDPAILANAYNLGDGTLVMHRIIAAKNETWLNMHCMVTVNGAGPSTGYSGLALYADDGTRLSKTADSLTTFTTGSPGPRGLVLETPVDVTINTHYWLAMLCCQGGGSPKVASTYAPPDIPEPVINGGHRRSIFLTGQTSFPATVDITTANLNNGIHWLAVS